MWKEELEIKGLPLMNKLEDVLYKQAFSLTSALRHVVSH